MTAAEKRSYVCKLALQFTNGGKYGPIDESLGDNKGDELYYWIGGFQIKNNKKTYIIDKDEYGVPCSKWLPGLSWCAAFISALAFWTDYHNKDNGGPSRIYDSTDSQYGIGTNNAYASGLKNYKNAKPGLAISWKNTQITKTNSTKGHVELVIDVNSNGITTIGGNTGSDGKSNGVRSEKKFYTWDKVKNPNSSRVFCAYIKLWDEDNDSLGQPVPDSNINVPDGNTNVPDGNTNISNNDESLAEKEKIQQDLSKLFVNINMSAEIKDVRKETSLEDGITTKNNKKSSKEQITIDRQTV